MKKVFISTLALGFALSGVSVFAEEAGIVPVPTLYQAPVASIAATMTTSAEVFIPTISVPSSVSPLTERSEVIGAKSLVRVQARGAQLIKERVHSLTSNASSVSESKLTAEQKLVFATFFSGKVADLTALGAKIAAGTDASSTKLLVASIFTDFRIYGIVIPQIRLEKRIYDLQNHIAKLTATFTSVQAKIDEQKAKGKDVTAWQKGLDGAKLLVTTDSVKLPALLSQISALKPADYGTTSKATIVSVNTGVRMIAKDLQSINRMMRRPQILHKMVVTGSVNASTTVGTH